MEKAMNVKDARILDGNIYIPLRNAAEKLVNKKLKVSVIESGGQAYIEIRRNGESKAVAWVDQDGGFGASCDPYETENGMIYPDDAKISTIDGFVDFCANYVGKALF